MPKAEPTAGASGIATRVVQESDLASKLAAEPGEAFPPVLSTTRMIALMEIAAARALRPILEQGELSVGVHVDVRHTAATPVGGSVRAKAKYTGMDGKLYVFEVVAEDEGGEIGRGTHRRAIVATDRLLDGAKKRMV